MEIFKLVGSIMIDNTAANQSIAKTEKQAEGLGNTLSSSFKDVAAVGATIAGVAASVGAALYGLASDAAEYGDNVAKSASRMQITTDSYQQLAFVADRCGVNMSVMEQAARKLEGTDLDLETAINNIMSVEDITARREAAIQTFGDKITYQLEPLLQTTKTDYEALKQEVYDLGGVMSEDGVKKSEAFKDAVTNLDTAWQGLKNTIGEAVMPAFTEFINWLSHTAIPTIGDFTAGLINAYTEADWGLKFEFGAASGSAGMHPKTPDGSHAAGLPTVPYDNYRANLHRGETVLNANDTGKLRDLLDGSTGSDAPVNITVQNILDGKVIGEYTYQYNRRKAQALGV